MGIFRMRLARSAALIGTAVVCASPVLAETIVEEGFEAGIPGAPWSVSGTAEGRATATAEYQPASGARHLVLDDSTTNEVFSAAHLTLRLDLSKKKAVQLSFKARSLGNEPHPPPTGSYSTHSYDTVSYSANGGLSWRGIRSLAWLGTDTETISVSLDPILAVAGESYNSAFEIRFSNYDNGSAPADGIAIDDIKVEAEPDQRVSLELPASAAEGSGPHNAFLILRFPQETDLNVQLSSSPPGSLLLPAMVSVSAGESVAPFTFSVADDGLVNFNRPVYLNPTAAGATPSPGLVNITDNEPKPTVTLALPPSVTEGTSPSSNASVSFSPPAAVSVAFTLSAAPASQLTIPSSVLLPAGQTSAAFSIRAVDDPAIDGDLVVTVSLHSSQIGTVTGTITAIDNEQPVLAIGLPATLVERQPANGTISISVSRPTDTVVNLATSPQGLVTVPGSITIPAGSTVASFSLTPVDDALVNLIRTFSISASGTRLTGATRNGTVADDEPPPVLRLSLPQSLREGESPTNAATLSLSFPLSFPVNAQIAGTPASEIVAPATVSIPAGTASVPFSLRAADDDFIDGSRTISLSASVAGIVTASAMTTTVDNETRTLTITGPAKINEGGTGGGRVAIPGKLPTALVVTLDSSHPATATTPSAVTIQAGTTESFFTITAPENALREGTLSVTLRADAQGFAGGAFSVPVFDNDVAAYRVSLPFDVLIAGREAWGSSVKAVDINGVLLSSYSGNVALHAVREDGTNFPLVPATVNLSGGSGWNGGFTLPAAAVAGTRAPIKIRAMDDAGYKGHSAEIDVAISLGFAAQDVVYDRTRGRIYGSVAAAASGPSPNKVIVINPEQRAVVGEIPSHQDPGALAMSAEDRYLYIAQRGNRTIGKADPDELTIPSSFSIGADPVYGPFHPSAVAASRADPELVVVARGINVVVPPRVSMAVFDGSTMRPVTVEGGALLEASADPSVFFTYYELAGAHLARLVVTGSGLESFSPAYPPFWGSAAFTTIDHSLVSSTGFIVNDQTLTQIGALPVVGNGPVCADFGGRVFFAERKDINANAIDRIRSYDTASLLPMGEVIFPEPLELAREMIRWGENGIAIRTLNDILLLESRTLVPSAAPVDLQLTLRPEMPAVPAGAPFRYLIEVVNASAAPATNIRLETFLSPGQQLSSATACSGLMTSTGQSCLLTVPSLAAGAKIDITVEAVSAGPGVVFATTRVLSASPDVAFNDNLRAATVTTGFDPSQGVANRLNLRAKNLLYDASRGRLWAILHESLPAPLRNALVSIDPATGIISLDTRLNAYISPGKFDVSSNGRYLYAATTGHVLQVDLASSPRSIARVPLPPNSQGHPQQVNDLAALEGDGTSFVVVGANNHHVLAFDGFVARPRTLVNSYDVSRIARYAPDRFTGITGNSGGAVFDLLVTAEGVAVGKVTPGGLLGTDIAGGAGRVLSSYGGLIDGPTHTLVGTLSGGVPFIDAEHRRAYSLSQDGLLRAYQLDDASAAGSQRMTHPDSDGAFSLVREGLDGFAAVDGDGSILLVRWSGTIPPEKDSDADYLPDAWEAAHFRTLAVGVADDRDGDALAAGLEWLFATSPTRSDPSPIGIVAAEPGLLRLTHPVRKGLQYQPLRYQLSENLVEWMTVTPLGKEVTATRIVEGAEVEDVVITLPAGMTASRFARVAWWPDAPE
jgi:Domain of unknown function DUF11